ncbi:hypothetical protein J2X12_004221 [Pseudarthrobacter oxydans]|uniref:Uncharacterized protein n=1 Tax=Pseudarthrobacter oxydans TaxID=1671 RepID=A0AAW8NFN7_PSEOX|nr:hypothetical protein [Pseudarthrobacter oxydans]MDR7166167.1 hypothetical protein [Pseudarthrobacter oxydans]
MAFKDRFFLQRQRRIDMPVTAAFDLTDDERELLRRGLLEWGGPASPTNSMAVAMGFRDIKDLLKEGCRIGADISEGRPLTYADWHRALLATEIVFASDVVGSGVDCSTTTGLEDEETIRMLRSLQRKIVALSG